MTDPHPNPSVTWGRRLVEELVAAGATVASITPGSRSTPLTLAYVEHAETTVFSHIDERSAAFFALGRSKATGQPTALVCTSGTAAANYHPAVLEADRSRTPLVVCTADRPPELQDSGANQTVDQDGIYGSAVRWSRTLPEPGAGPRKLRALRVAAGRAVAASLRPPAGPVHLNVPFPKPLSPTRGREEPSSPPPEDPGTPADGREPPFFHRRAGRRTLATARVDRLAEAIDDSERGLIVAGPRDPVGGGTAEIADLARMTGFPVLADPLSGLRFGTHVGTIDVCGGYDAYLRPRVTEGWPDPDLVVRFGASPTSKTLRAYLARIPARQLLVDPAGGWREATFTATDLLEADPDWLASRLAERVDETARRDGAWAALFRRAEAQHWSAVDGAEEAFEGAYVATAIESLPEGATVVASNSMPVRDLDRFGRPAETDLTVLGNRGASGIDGVTSTALGAASASDDPLVLITGDLAFYHDMNGLLAVDRCGVEATIVVLDNDGGGIFHRLPIADHGAFTEWFKTPHGLDFSPTRELYGLEFERVGSMAAFRAAFESAVGSAGTTVLSVECDAAESHAVRDVLRDRACAAIVAEE